MYKVLKDKGNNSNVILKNTDTNAELKLGLLNLNIIAILKDEGYEFEADGTSLKYKDAWDLNVSDEAGHELSKLAMKMVKPKRDQSKKPESEQKSKPKTKQPVDVFDLIFGTN